MPSSLRNWIPDIRLSDEAFATRNRALLIVLWLTVPLLFGLASTVLGSEEMSGPSHGGHVGTGLVWVLITAVAFCAAAASMVHGRRASTILVSTGFLLAAAALVPAGGGLTDLHFGFFVVLGLISVYQDWTVLALSVVIVAVHHLFAGLVVPRTLYSDPAAANAPVRWALMHSAFVVAMCAVEVAYWRFAAQAQSEKDAIRSQSNQALRQSEERFRAIVQDSSDVIYVIDGDGLITLVSPGVERVTGHLPEDLVGATYQSMIHGDDRPKLVEMSDREPDRRVEVRARHADGSWRWHDVTLRDLTEHPAVRGVVANHRDITERRTFQELLIHEASHDALTGLANRSAFMRGLDGTLTDASQRNARTAVLFIDLDGFKQVNDTLGHDSGDALLVATATALRRGVLGADVVGRLGGDEFGIVLTDLHGADDAISVVKRILNEFTHPVSLPGGPVRPRASVGIAVSEPGNGDMDALLHQADVAMYRAKREGLSGWKLFAEGVDARESQDASPTEDLARATTDGESAAQNRPRVTLPAACRGEAWTSLRPVGVASD